MSDFVIPGVTSNINTDKIVKALVDVERVPMEKMQEDVKTYEQTKKAWQDLNMKLTKLKDSAGALYGFQNPFSERVAESSDEQIITATATREAVEEQKEIIVKKIARADKFISRPQDKEFKVEAGTYKFKVGDKEAQFRFTGGSLKDFAKTINSKSKDLLKASVIPDTKNSEVILIEGIKTGSKNKIEFLEDFKEFALKAGIIESTISNSREVNLDSTAIEKWDIPLDKNRYTIEENRLNLRPGSELKLPITPPLEINKNMILEMEVTIEEIPEEVRETEKKPEGPTLPDAGEIIFKDIRIQNEKSKVILPSQKPPEIPPKIEDMQVLFATAKGKDIPLPALNPGTKTATIKIPIGEYTDIMEGLALRNRNTHKIISFENIKIYDPTVRGDYRPVNPLAESGDAVLSMDGIEIIREDNFIDDLIPGVNLTLHSTSNTPVDLNIKQDKELIKDSIITFVGYYNQIITTIDNLSRPSDEMIDSLDYLSDDEKEAYKENAGLLQGEMTLMHLKTSLKNVMMNPYRTSDDNDLSLLAQIGISTDTSKPGTSSSINKYKLRGYLEIDEKKLEESIDRYKSSLKELFGWDSDQDLIVDTGLAFSTDTSIKPYTALGGILATKNQTLDTRIDRKEKDIENYKKHLEDYEQSLKVKYSTMEGMVEALKKNSEALDNFNNQNK